MKLSITNFRNIDSLEIDGSKIHIQGKNWAGKSNILRAIERCLFWTIYGRKQWITPVKIWEEHCRVALHIGEDARERNDGDTAAYVNAAMRPIMFCNLLDQEYPYIKKVLADILIQDKAKPMFGKLWMWSIESSITNVKTTRTSTNKEFLKIKNRIDFLNEEISKQEHITVENMEKMEEQYATKKLELNKYSSQEGDTLTSLDNWIKLLESQSKDTEQRIRDYKVNLNRLLIVMQTKLDEWTKLKEAKCPTCWSDYKDDSLLQKTRNEYKDAGLAIEELRQTIQTLEQSLVKITTEIQEQEKTRLAILNSASDTIISQTTLENEVNWLFKLIADYWAKLQQKNSRESELQKLVDQLIKLEQQEVFTVNDKISPQGELNQLLQSEIHSIFPELTFNIIEENTYGEFKSTMAVYYNDIEYKELSRSEKLFVNVMVSTRLMELKPNIKYPLLLDDSEMFSKAHITKLENLLAKSSVEYIITKVCSCALQHTAK